MLQDLLDLGTSVKYECAKSQIDPAETIILGTWSTNVRLEDGCYGFTDLVVSRTGFLFYRSIIQAHCIFFSSSYLFWVIYSPYMPQSHHQKDPKGT